MPIDGSSRALAADERQFVRRVLIVAGIAALAAVLWVLSEIFLLVFGSVLLAVILRSVAAVFAAHTGMRTSYSLMIAGLVIVALVAAAILLFGAQLRGQFDVLASQLGSACILHCTRAVPIEFSVAGAQQCIHRWLRNRVASL
jgi:predicted PurR-regulated permease PerM